MGSTDQNIGSEIENMGSSDQNVGSETKNVGSKFVKYEMMLQNTGVTKTFISKIEIVYIHARQKVFKKSDVMEYRNGRVESESNN